MNASTAPSTCLYTVGHSTRQLLELLDLLRAHGIRQLVDVRTIPRSRHNPQFNRDTLSRFLRSRRIGYRHMPELGGLRHARPDSQNLGWRNASFRGYADYMQTPEFDQAVGALIALAGRKPTAIMCAESVPWRCHRSLIADALLARGLQVRHIYTPTRALPHMLTPLARVHGIHIVYPPSNGETQEQLSFD
jgi:uncharacterized protein (DUF488 family)